ncbi:TolC family outer membrane protein [Candidatus Endowatersipora endosymbiont of Watersipora subatra]|uniref:TolC family outer membrane protein n=1 Tax=Candidatus Endowatersipora endosymbiont of Watersipora subatra TaxID=3077946 RepID=UPI00312C9E1A
MQFLNFLFGIGVVFFILDSAHAENLRSALSSAYRYNATLKAQRAAERASHESLPQSMAYFLPQISALADIGVSDTVLKHSNVLIDNDKNIILGGLGLTIKQNLFNGFRSINSLAVAKADILANREILRNLEQDILLKAIIAYIDVIRDHKMVKIQRKNLDFLNEQLRSSQSQLNVGEGIYTDLVQSQAQLYLSQAKLIASKANLKAARGTYYKIIGNDPKQLTWPKLPFHLYPGDLQKAIAVGLVENPAVVRTQYLVDRALFTVKISEGASLPTLNAQVTASRNYNKPTDGDISNLLSAKLNLKIPLYQGGILESQGRANKAILSQRRFELDQARNNVRNLIISAWTKLESARARCKGNQVQLSAAKLSLSGILEKSHVGLSTKLDVLIAKNSLFQAKEMAIQSRHAEIIAGYSLISAIGRLNTKQLSLNF